MNCDFVRCPGHKTANSTEVCSGLDEELAAALLSLGSREKANDSKVFGSHRTVTELSSELVVGMTVNAHVEKS